MKSREREKQKRKTHDKHSRREHLLNFHFTREFFRLGDVRLCVLHTYLILLMSASSADLFAQCEAEHGLAPIPTDERTEKKRTTTKTH